MPKVFFFMLVLASLFLEKGVPSDSSSSVDTSTFELDQAGADHASWNALLQKYADSEGNVDYAGITKEKGKLNTYLAYLDKHAPAEGWSKNEKLAYYINLYNAATVKLIVDNYPIKSIKDIGNPWDKKWVLINGKKYSLGNIEHKILRKMDEPRIHFAINCASYSCPKLVNKAFLPKTLEEQLEAAAVDFINDTFRNKISEKKVQLSHIFKWYKGDFTEKSSLVEYLNRYSKTKAGKKAKVSYLTYDWGLNESR